MPLKKGYEKKQSAQISEKKLKLANQENKL